MLLDKYFVPPFWSRRLCNLYVQLRKARKYDLAARRRFYRYIEKERHHLVNEGHSPEYVRLICRYLSEPRNRVAEERCIAFEETEKVLSWAQCKSRIFRREMAF